MFIVNFILLFIALALGSLLSVWQLRFTLAVSTSPEPEKSGFVRDSILNGFFRRPRQFVEACLLAKLFLFFLFVALCFCLFIPSVEDMDLSTVVLILICLACFFGFAFVWFSVAEMLPRIFCRYGTPPASIRSLLSGLVLVYVCFYPLVSLFLKLADGIRWLLKIPSGTPRIGVREDGFDVLQHRRFEAQAGEELETERQIIRNVIDFSSVRVKECMVPRTEIVGVNLLTATDGELREKFSKSGLSRLLVYRENIDQVVGYLHVSEMFDSAEDWKERIKEMPFVPETMAAHDLMHDLTQKQKNIAVVVDEFGGTLGIVTLEDLVEEIFGEIEDEHDKRSAIERKIGEDEYIFSGRLEVDYINEKYNLNLPVSEDYQTLAGYLLFVNRRFPNLNQVIEVGGISFTILKMTPTKLELVKVLLKKQHPTTAK